MPFINVAGTDLDVYEFKEEDSIVEGSADRSWSNLARSNERSEARRWSGRVNEMTQANYETFRAAVRLGKEVNVYGDAIAGATSGAPRLCVVRITNVDYVRNGTNFLVEFDIAIDSVGSS